MSSDRKLKGAVVGVGYLGNFHAQKIKAHPKAELIGVCDRLLPQAEKIASELNVNVFQKPQDLIGQVDFVHVVTATQFHYETAKFFLDHQIPVLVEKPIASTVQQAEELCDLARKNKTFFTVGHIERFNPAFMYLKENSAGIQYLEMNRLAPFRPRGADVSVLHDLMIHDIDLVNWIFKSKIKRYSITAAKIIKPTFDDVSLRLELENSVQVTINNSRVNPVIVRNYRFVKANEVQVVNTATLEVEISRPQQEDPFQSVEKQTLQKQDALALEIDHFIQAILGTKQVMITGEEATLALKQVEEFAAAIK